MKYGDPVKRFQMHCPKCGYEFVWDLSPADREAEKQRMELKKVDSMIAEMKAAVPAEALKDNMKYKELKARAAKAHERLARIKRVKQANHEITEKVWNQEFREAIKDKYGQEAFDEILETVKDRLRPESIEKLMKERV